MPDSAIDQVLDVVRQRGILRPRDLDRYSLPRQYLHRLYQRGELVQLARGLYALPNHDLTEHHDLAEANTHVPHGVICLLSALRQVLLTRYVLERFLYRLSQSPYQDRFVVKGAMLFLLWEGEFHRTTRDLDLLAFGSSEIAHLEAAVREICTVAVEEDGVMFHEEIVCGRAIREDQIYDGVRLNVEAHLGSARLPLQIDIGFGDAIIPMPAQEDPRGALKRTSGRCYGIYASIRCC